MSKARWGTYSEYMETPFDPTVRLGNDDYSGTQYARQSNASPPLWKGVPSTAIQALMEAAPGCEPATSIEEYKDLREALVDALDVLAEEDPQAAWFFDRIVIERWSYRALANEMAASLPDAAIGKSQMHRVVKRAKERLQEILADNTIVKEFLSG